MSSKCQLQMQEETREDKPTKARANLLQQVTDGSNSFAKTSTSMSLGNSLDRKIETKGTVGSSEPDDPEELLDRHLDWEDVKPSLNLQKLPIYMMS